MAAAGGSSNLAGRAKFAGRRSFAPVVAHPIGFLLGLGVVPLAPRNTCQASAGSGWTRSRLRRTSSTSRSPASLDRWRTPSSHRPGSWRWSGSPPGCRATPGGRSGSSRLRGRHCLALPLRAIFKTPSESDRRTDRSGDVRALGRPDLLRVGIEAIFVRRGDRAAGCALMEKRWARGQAGDAAAAHRLRGGRGRGGLVLASRVICAGERRGRGICWGGRAGTSGDVPRGSPWSGAAWLASFAEVYRRLVPAARRERRGCGDSGPARSRPCRRRLPDISGGACARRSICS